MIYLYLFILVVFGNEEVELEVVIRGVNPE
jgi:hypothetical protein